MPKKNKYRPGELITSVSELEAHLEAGGWVYWHDGKPKHPEIIKSLQLRTIKYFIRKQAFKKAILNQ